jgi:hypothetical protein
MVARTGHHGLCVMAALAGAMMLGMMSPGEALAEEEPPIVVTSFEVVAPSFEDFNADNEPGLAVDVANTIASLCGMHFGFLRWMAEETDGATDTVPFRLTLKLTSTGTSSGALTPAIDLEYYGVLDGQESKLALLSSGHLYRAYDDRPQTAASLFDKICARVTEELSSDGFREDVVDKFLSDIPLAREVDVLEVYGILILPLRWEALRVHHSSELDMVFSTHVDDAGGIMLPCKAVLTPCGKAQPGPLMCSVSEFNCGGAVEFKQWDPQIPGYLDRDRLDFLSVSMMHYEPDTHPLVDDGVVTQLPEEDSP